MVIIPVIHIIPIWTDTINPFIIINVSTESIFFSKCEVLGFLDQLDTGIGGIVTSLALEPLALEVTAEQPENPLPYRESLFISSLLEISVHGKLALHDVG